MSKTGLDNRHRNQDGDISHKNGNTHVGTLRKIYGQGFAAGYPATVAATFESSLSGGKPSTPTRRHISEFVTACATAFGRNTSGPAR